MRQQATGLKRSERYQLGLPTRDTEKRLSALDLIAERQRETVQFLAGTDSQTNEC